MDLSFAMESPPFAINGSAFNAMPSAFVVSGENVLIDRQAIKIYPDA